MVCDVWLVVSIHFVSFYVLRFVACDRNYDWRYTSEKRNSDKLAFKLHSSRLMNGFKLP